MSKIKVSALVSTFNSSYFLSRCLDNLLCQTIAPQLEIIVINSGSEQNEKVIIKQYLKDHSNIIYIETKERETLYKAWNRGIKHASGQYLISANTDDTSKTNALEVMSKLLDKNNNTPLIYTDYYMTSVIDDDITLSEKPYWKKIPAPAHSMKNLLLRCYCGPRPMWHRELHTELGYFDESYLYAGDYEFWLRVAEKFPFLQHNEALHLYLNNDKGLWRNNHYLNEEIQIKKKYLIKS